MKYCEGFTWVYQKCSLVLHYMHGLFSRRGGMTSWILKPNLEMHADMLVHAYC